MAIFLKECKFHGLVPAHISHALPYRWERCMVVRVVADGHSRSLERIYDLRRFGQHALNDHTRQVEVRLKSMALKKLHQTERGVLAVNRNEVFTVEEKVYVGCHVSSPFS